MNIICRLHFHLYMCLYVHKALDNKNKKRIEGVTAAGRLVSAEARLRGGTVTIHKLSSCLSVMAE